MQDDNEVKNSLITSSQFEGKNFEKIIINIINIITNKMRNTIKRAFLIAQVRKMADEGLSASQISGKLKYSYQIINRIIRENNIKIQKPANKLIEKIRELAGKEFSVRQIAKEINRNISTTFQHMVEHNIPRANKRKFIPVPVPDEIIEKMKELSEKNMSARQISKEINKTEITTYRYMVKYNIPRTGRLKKQNYGGENV